MDISSKICIYNVRIMCNITKIPAGEKCNIMALFDYSFYGDVKLKYLIPLFLYKHILIEFELILFIKFCNYFI